MAHQSLLDDLLENPDDNDDGQPCQPDTIDTQELALFGQAHQIEKVHQAAAMERVGMKLQTLLNYLSPHWMATFRTRAGH